MSWVHFKKFSSTSSMFSSPNMTWLFIRYISIMYSLIKHKNRSLLLKIPAFTTLLQSEIPHIHCFHMKNLWNYYNMLFIHIFIILIFLFPCYLKSQPFWQNLIKFSRQREKNLIRNLKINLHFSILICNLTFTDGFPHLDQVHMDEKTQ